MYRLLLCFLLTPLLLCAEHDIPTIVDRIDKLFRSEDSEVEIEMQVITPNWERTLEMTAWSRGMEDTFIVVRSPKKDKGVSTLRRGDEMWNYFPKVDRVIKVPPSLMKSGWMGSDFTNDDLVKETTLLEDYTAQWSDDAPDQESLWIDLVPNKDTVTVWDRIVLKVDPETYIPSEQRYYGDRGELIRVMYLSEIKDLGGRNIPTRVELIPEGEENRRTVVTYKKAIFDKGVADDVFSLRNLRKRR